MENKFRIKAKNFIDNVIEKSNRSYDILMTDLENKIEDWRSEYRILSYINIFELSNIQYDRKCYLDNLITYGERLVSRRRLNKNSKLTKCVCCGK